jgi:hypothetical protein
MALGEANAASYIASLTATVAMGLFTATDLDWRNGLALGIELTAVALARLAGDPIPAARPHGESGAGRLPAAYWACRAPPRPAVAAAFSAAMLTGRLFAAPLLRLVYAQRLFLASLALTLPGIAPYVCSPGL